MLTEHPPFAPRRLMRAAHAQTLGAYLLRGTEKTEYRATKAIVPLSDGDQLVIHDDRPDDWNEGDRVVILYHGLCGSHLSPYCIRVAEKLRCLGLRAIRVDMRGFGESTLVSRSHLHGGLWQDVQSVVEHIHQETPQSPITLLGFSLGGNVVLRSLGKWGRRLPPGVDSGIAVCPPIDLVRCADNIRQRGNRFYESYFVRRLSEQLVRRRQAVPDLVDNGLNPLPTRLIHWDDQFTAPCWGYRGAIEYYEDASAAPWLDRVSVPTIILTSQDDPIIPFSMFQEATLSSDIQLVCPTHGGHLGFLSDGREDVDRHWMDWRVLEWITGLRRRNEDVTCREFSDTSVSEKATQGSRIVVPS